MTDLSGTAYNTFFNFNYQTMPGINRVSVQNNANNNSMVEYNSGNSAIKYSQSNIFDSVNQLVAASKINMAEIQKTLPDQNNAITGKSFNITPNKSNQTTPELSLAKKLNIKLREQTLTKLEKLDNTIADVMINQASVDPDSNEAQLMQSQIEKLAEVKKHHLQILQITFPKDSPQRKAIGEMIKQNDKDTQKSALNNQKGALNSLIAKYQIKLNQLDPDSSEARQNQKILDALYYKQTELNQREQIINLLSEKQE